VTLEEKRNNYFLVSLNVSLKTLKALSNPGLSTGGVSSSPEYIHYRPKTGKAKALVIQLCAKVNASKMYHKGISEVVAKSTLTTLMKTVHT
jgi:hypothetical protein